jgi:hypothetical protein
LVLLGFLSVTKKTRIGEWSEFNVVCVHHNKDGTRWAEANVTSGEEGDWFSALGMRVEESPLRIIKSLLSIDEANESLQELLREENDSAPCALKSPK